MTAQLERTPVANANAVITKRGPERPREDEALVVPEVNTTQADKDKRRGRKRTEAGSQSSSALG